MGLLEKSREYEAKMKSIVDPERPSFHVTGMSGWINDPNGFSTYKGEYHLFFQYHPYDVVWGPMHWGHVTTKDFIKWEHLPLAIAPDQPYDVKGCISGSAIELEDGRQLLFYTGMSMDDYNNMPDLPEPKDPYQNHCIAFGDGLNYEKYEGNPNLVASTAPKGSWLQDFRDPKIWKEEDGYYAIMCSRPEDGTGQILMYKSQDVIHWDFVSILAYNHKKMGKVWECPDFFELDGRRILMVSPQEMESDGLEYHPGYNTIVFMGNYDRENHLFQEECNHAIDYGTDFYAPQTLESFDGRRIMIAWMSNWDATNFKNPGDHFYGMMSLPRELHVKGDRLYQLPVRELDNYRIGSVSHKNVAFEGCRGSEEIHLDGIKGRFLDLNIHVKQEEGDALRRFDLKLAMDEKHYFLISFDPEESTVRVDRSYSGCRNDMLHGRTFAVADNGGELKLRIILDRYSVEIFANDGEQAASFVFFTPLDAEGIAFHTNGSAHVDVDQYILQR